MYLSTAKLYTHLPTFFFIVVEQRDKYTDYLIKIGIQNVNFFHVFVQSKCNLINCVFLGKNDYSVQTVVPIIILVIIPSAPIQTSIYVIILYCLIRNNRYYTRLCIQ